MRKIGEKVALIAQICVAIIFVIVALLYVLGIIPQAVWQDHAVIFVVMAVLATIFVGTSVYLVYMNFSEVQNLRRVLLYADCKSATTTTVKVLTKIARNCSKKIDGVNIKKTKIRADEKKGYIATFVVEVSAQTVTPALEQLRCLIEDSFKDTLGLVFNTITFDVARLTSEPKADVNKAQKRARAITNGANEVQDIYDNPTGEKPTDVVLPLPVDQVTDVSADEQVDFDETTIVTPSETVDDVAVEQTVDETVDDETPTDQSTTHE